MRNNRAHAYRHNARNRTPAHLIDTDDDRRTLVEEASLDIESRSDAHHAVFTRLAQPR